jgi:predicted metal-dependent peptidase
MAREIVLPRLCPEMEIEHGVFVFDTSGSIDDTILTEFCSELEAILNTVRMKVTILMVDAKVHEPVYHFEPGDFSYKALKFLGRGGTAFEPAFEWVEEQGIAPTFMVYFTDTYGSFPDAPPDYPVLWAVTHPNGTVPWGEYLCMKEAAV